MSKTARTSKLALIHIGKKHLRLDDETYRDMLDDLFDVRSAADLSGKQMDELINHMKAIGFKPISKRKKMPAHKAAQIGKIRMLWVSLWDLGVVHDDGEAALLSFVKRLTGKQALQWLSERDAGKVIEALKDWAHRDGGVNWEPVYSIENKPIQIPRVRVVEAQWVRLGKLSQLKQPNAAGLKSFLATFLSCDEVPIFTLPDNHLDSARIRLGRWIRSAQEDVS